MGVAHALEAALVRGGLWLLARLSAERASNLGGFAARSIGPFLPVSRVARRNLGMALPELSEGAREQVVRGVWDNLGRTAAELAHVARLMLTPSGPGLELVGADHVRMLSGPAILVSGHLGNWETLPRAASLIGVRLALLYRAAGNPAVDDLIAGLRRDLADGAPSFAKGAAGARGALRHLRGGGILAMLVDQKMNDGIPAMFFGRPAMTASAAASFARRFGCPVVPVRCERLGPARLRVTCEAPLPASDDVAAMTQAINDRLEAWIRDQPSQWLWLHRRWPKEVTAASAAPASSLQSPRHPHPQS